MARTLLLCLCLLWGVPASAGNLSDLDADNGFGGARLGENIAGFEGLELISRHGARGTSLYTRSGAASKLGDASLDDVTYGFYRDQLYFVALFTSGRYNARAALMALQGAYGPGIAIPGDASEFVWRGDRVTLHFREDPVTEMGMVGFTSAPIDREIKRQALPASASKSLR